MDTNNVLGEILEKGQSAVQKSAKTVADSASNVVKTTASQATGQDQGEQNIQDNAQKANDKAQVADMVKDIYSPSNPNVKAPSKEQAEAEDKAKLVSLRQKLHDEVYYQPLIAGQKAQEERPAEKVEREKVQEMQDLQKKEDKKPTPLAVQRAQQSAEKFRGVSG